MQVLQDRGDDPRSTSGVDLELSGLEVLSDGRRNRRLWSLSGLDIAWRRGGKTERVCGPGSREDRGGEKSVRTEKGGRSLTGGIVHFIVRGYVAGGRERRTPR